jgi:hypothetical protein
MVLDEVEWPISWDKAKEVRQKLVAERSIPENIASQYFVERFLLCEH